MDKKVFTFTDGKRGCHVSIHDPTPAKYDKDKICLKFFGEEDTTIYMTTEEAIAISCGLLAGYMKLYELEDKK